MIRALVTRRPAAALTTALVLTAACGGYRQPPPLRPDPIPYADTLPIPEPRGGGPSEAAMFLSGTVFRPLIQPLQPRARWEAANVTQFDDVVSSAWFEHRNGRTPMTPEQVARGPTDRAPETRRSLTVTGAKYGGVTPGFMVRDARGDRYLFKFDAASHPRLGSAAGVIANRLFYAAGYHVPEDYVVVFDSARLEIGPDARVTIGGRERPMTPEDVHQTLSGTAPLPDGRFRALASQLVPGVPKGPFRFNGTRPDDPNDYYPHEYRRDLRGLLVVAAWLNHADLRYGNCLDSYVEPGYLRHYLIDFASSLGSSAGRAYYGPKAGAESMFDVWRVSARLLTLGLFRAPWEREEFEIIHPSIGWISTETFRPGHWRPGWPNRALQALTPADGYWGAKLVGSFSDGQLHTAVGQGRLPAVAADTLVDILAYRRDKVTRHWYGKVTPVENVSLEDGADDGRPAIVFDDLGIAAGHWEGTATRYRWHLSHPARGLRRSGRAAGTAGTRQRVALRLSTGDDADTMGEASTADRALEGTDRLAELRLVAERPTVRGRPATIYLRWEGPSEGYTVVALRH